MELATFSVKNYRSITTAYKLPIKQSTVLIGPNNEGKSNILRALVTALKALQSLDGSRPRTRGLIRSLSYYGDVPNYDWTNDFPISLQASKPNGDSVFDIQFKLSPTEIDEFYSEVKSSIDGNLPIRLTLGKKQLEFRVVKKGPGGPALSKKAERIANFISKRLNINYIPAVRTAEAAQEVVKDMVDTALRTIEESTDYQQALQNVAKLQQPMLDNISDAIRETLRVFLPNVKSVRVGVSQDERIRALRRCKIVVDDGTPTDLSRKGDGVQSLAALSLLRQTAEHPSRNAKMILAIEEPESHLHPNAIQQLRRVLAEIASTNQIIMTTHCPLFVDRENIKSNIVVHGNKATPAKSVSDVRDILGVRASDNLRHAELILVVEGEDDKTALTALFQHHSPILKSALSGRSLAIESLQGASNLSYKLSTLREALCTTHTLLDNDAAGRNALNKAKQDGLIEESNYTVVIVGGLSESEFEDLIETALYADLLQNSYGVSTQSPKFKGNKKWSDRLQAAFHHQGKIWNDQIESKIKAEIAELIIANPESALNGHKRNIFDALVDSLHKKLGHHTQTTGAGSAAIPFGASPAST